MGSEMVGSCRKQRVLVGYGSSMLRIELAIPIFQRRGTAAESIFVKDILSLSVRRTLETSPLHGLSAGQHVSRRYFRRPRGIQHILQVVQTDCYDSASANVGAAPFTPTTPEGLADHKFAMFHEFAQPQDVQAAR
jgi:hypothetical protein